MSRTEQAMLVHGVTRANLAIPNFVANHNSSRQICGGPRLRRERLLYETALRNDPIIQHPAPPN